MITAYITSTGKSVKTFFSEVFLRNQKIKKLQELNSVLNERLEHAGERHDMDVRENYNLRSQNRQLQNQLSDLRRRHAADIHDWNNLVAWVKSVGGVKYVTSVMTGQTPQSNLNFSDKDLQKILMLIHPDKHGGKQMAVDMTAKVLELRKTR